MRNVCNMRTKAAASATTSATHREFSDVSEGDVGVYPRMAFLFRPRAETDAVARALDNDTGDAGEIVQLGHELASALVSDDTELSSTPFAVAVTPLQCPPSTRSAQLARLICYAQTTSQVNSGLILLRV